MKVLVLACILGAALARCPNDCSGRGVCNAGSTCECERNWAGNDCSQRVCFYGLSFIDSPLGDIDGSDSISTLEQAYLHHANAPVGEQYDPAYALARDDNTNGWDEAHFYAECSNKGVCDRSTGQCECFPGFEGEGCQRLSCPNDCSGKGQCVVVGNTNSDSYNAWDADKTVACVCDPGFTGPDCSLRKCSGGVDPIENVYTDTSSVYKIEWGSVGDGINSPFYDTSANQKFMPNGAVLWTVTITDDYGDAWTTSAVTTYYNAQSICSVFDDATCTSRPHYFDDGSDVFADTTVAYSSSDLFEDSFIGEQVNASIQALPNDIVRNSYVWVALNDATTPFLYPSFSVPDTPIAASPADCQTSICGTNDFSAGPSLFVNDEAYRFPFWAAYDDSTLSSYLNCADNALCVFVKLDDPQNSRHFEVDYKYQAAVGDDAFSAEFTGNTYNVDGSDISVVSVSEVGSDRTWLAAVDGTPSIDFESDQTMHVCSKRGMCDYDTGLCNCFDGYSGYRCDMRSTTGIY